MSRRARDTVLVVLAAVLAVAFVRLGVWQLDRLRERRAYNARVRERLSEPAVAVAALPRDSGKAHFRRVVVDGVYDYAQEMVLVARSRNGAPGVNVITPVRLAGSDTALLVNRGWVYSPDGTRADLPRWREGEANGAGDSVRGTGYVVPFGAGRAGRPAAGGAALPGRPRALRWLDTAAMRSLLPYPVYPVQVVLEGDSVPNPPAPPRVPPPALDEGPHWSYAMQWFSFAVIAVVGTVLFLMHSRRERRSVDPLRLMRDD